MIRKVNEASKASDGPVLNVTKRGILHAASKSLT